VRHRQVQVVNRPRSLNGGVRPRLQPERDLPQRKHCRSTFNSRPTYRRPAPPVSAINEPSRTRDGHPLDRRDVAMRDSLQPGRLTDVANPGNCRRRVRACRNVCGTVIFGAAAQRSMTFLILPSIWLTSMTHIPALPLSRRNRTRLPLPGRRRRHRSDRAAHAIAVPSSRCDLCLRSDTRRRSWSGLRWWHTRQGRWRRFLLWSGRPARMRQESTSTEPPRALCSSSSPFLIHFGHGFGSGYLLRGVPPCSEPPRRFRRSATDHYVNNKRPRCGRTDRAVRYGHSRSS
jgi:hypothetical protein